MEKVIEKPQVKVLKNIVEVLQYCKQAKIPLSPETEYFLEGIELSGKYPRVVSEEKYLELKWRYDQLVDAGVKLVSRKKRRWF